MKKLSRAELNTLQSLTERAVSNNQCIPCSVTPTTQPMPVTALETTLAERGNRYGDFSDHARIAQQLQDVMRNFTKLPVPHTETFSTEYPWNNLSPVQKQALTVIADKIARILNGDPNYADNWHDIQGYAKLVEDRLPKSE